MESGGYIGVSHHLTRPHSLSHQRSVKQQVVLEPVGFGSFPPSASDIRSKRYSRNYVGDTPNTKKAGPGGARDCRVDEIDRQGSIHDPSHACASSERELMFERQREGIAKAKAEGKYKGRKPTARARAAEVNALKADGVRPVERPPPGDRSSKRVSRLGSLKYARVVGVTFSWSKSR